MRDFRVQSWVRIACALFAILTNVHLAALEPIRIHKDGKSFVLGDSGKRFRVWGVNYDHDSNGSGRLLEDYWQEEWATVRSDLQEIKDLGANVVRIHLQLGKFMSSPEAANTNSLQKLRELLELSQELGLYLDITGLGCYHKSDTPAWYDKMSEADRWQVQARFWSAIAKTCRHSSAVFCYDLMNEPIIGGKKDEGWVGGELGGKSYVQRLTLDPAQRTNIEIAKAWVNKLTAAIRAEDPHHLITVGAIPWAMVWPNAKPIFYAPEVRGALDFVSIHVYPRTGEMNKALDALRSYELGKPLLIEETFPLSCTLEEMDTFIKESRERVGGYVSFYWGQTTDQYSGAPASDIAATITREWLKYFKLHAEEMKRP